MQLRISRTRPRTPAASARALFFWRDHSGHEVDLVIEQGATLVPVEIKSGQTVQPAFFRGIEDWRHIAGQPDGEAWLVFGGDREERRGGLRVLPWRSIGELGAAVG